LLTSFDWNPWIQEIGAQGDFISLGYSGSKRHGGRGNAASRCANPDRIRPPTPAFSSPAGNGVMDGLKVAVEYSANWDYPVSSGGTGKVAHGVFGLLQLNF